MLGSPDVPPVEPATWNLVFKRPPRLPIFSNSKIVDVKGGPLQIMLVFAGTGSPLLPPQPLRIELVPLLGNSLPNNVEKWSADAFTKGIAKEHQGRRPPLTGDVVLTMRDGCVTVNELQFMDNSPSVFGRKFRIGARVVPGSYEGARIREAVTEAFNVRHHRTYTCTEQLRNARMALQQRLVAQRNKLQNIPVLQKPAALEALSCALEDAMVKLPAKLDGLLISHGHMLPKGAGDEIPLIKQDLQKMMTILQDEDSTRSKEPHMMVKCWMKEVRELSYDIDDCIDQYEHGAADPTTRSGFNRRKISRRASSYTIRISRRATTRLPENLKRRLWMANKIREFSIRSQAALERYSLFDLGNISSSSTRFDVDVSFGSWHPKKYRKGADHPVGIDVPMNEPEELLTKDKDEEQKLKVVSICGTGGVGKTMLANELYRKVGGQFECRAFVRTSKRPDIRMLLINMLYQVAPQHHPENWKVHSLIASISTHLQNKRYLIVIDDVWDTSSWEIVKCALPDGNRCSGILVTTETEDVALRCCGYDSNYVFMMKPLGENDSSKLFFNSAFGPQHECLPELNEVSKSIMRKCGGLPLAIVTIASLLASRLNKAEHWDYVD